MPSKPELMAPAGSVDAGYAALHYGADSIYLGLKQFSARADAANFTPDAIAGLTDVSGRVLGLMPHPDRAYLPHHMPDWRRTGLGKVGDGLALFESMVRAARDASS